MNVGSFSNALEAHFVQGLLEQRGIPSFVVGEATGTTWGFSMGPAEGIRIAVREEDLDAAKAVLEEVAHHEETQGTEAEEPLAEDFGPEPDEPTDTEEGGPLAEPVSDGGAWARRVRALAVLLIPIGFTTHWLLGAIPPLLFTVVVFVLLLTSRAREEASPAGRRYLSHAWVALIVAVAFQVALAVVPLMHRR